MNYLKKLYVLDRDPKAQYLIRPELKRIARKIEEEGLGHVSVKYTEFDDSQKWMGTTLVALFPWGSYGLSHNGQRVCCYYFKEEVDSLKCTDFLAEILSEDERWEMDTRGTRRTDIEECDLTLPLWIKWATAEVVNERDQTELAQKIRDLTEGLGKA